MGLEHDLENRVVTLMVTLTVMSSDSASLLLLDVMNSACMTVLYSFGHIRLFDW